MRRALLHGVGLVAALVVSVSAAGDWSGAERKYDEFKAKHEALRRLLPNETKNIVTAICEAEEEDRRSAGQSAKSRVESTIQSELSSLKSLRDDADQLLRDVQSDAALADRHSKAKEYQDELSRRWDRVLSMRGINHPVTAFLVDQGQTEHKNYQSNSSNCHVNEFTMNSGRADCLIAAGSTCYVVELKPDNSRAISKGRDQSDDYAEELNTNGDTRAKLIAKDSRFASCTRFEPRVDCYKLCPDLDEENNMKSTAPVWRSRC